MAVISVNTVGLAQIEHLPAKGGMEWDPVAHVLGHLDL